MDEPVITFVVEVVASEPGGEPSDFVRQAAEQSASNTADGEPSFVMVTTDIRDGRTVKRVEFESPAAAEHFEAMVGVPPSSIDRS